MKPKKAKVDHVEPRLPGSLPSWFTKNRVHGHTRLILSQWPHDSPHFARAAAGFKALGAHAFARHAKTGDEDPWWLTGEPDPNIVQEFIESAHAEGLRIFAYYWHMSQKSLEDLYPDWVCRRLDGTPIDASERGIHLDITGPYREVVLTHLLELAAMGADGLFFDFRHLPARGCWGSALAAAWQATHGAPPPAPNDSNQLYQQFLDFKAQKIEETFIYWRDQVKAAHPNVVFIVSTTTVPALTDREMTTRLASIADSAKNEYRHALEFSKQVFDAPNLKNLQTTFGRRSGGRCSATRRMGAHLTSGLAVSRTASTHGHSPVACSPSAASRTWTSTSATSAAEVMSRKARRQSPRSRTPSRSATPCHRTWPGRRRCDGPPFISARAAATRIGTTSRPHGGMCSGHWSVPIGSSPRKECRWGS